MWESGQSFKMLGFLSVMKIVVFYKTFFIDYKKNKWYSTLSLLHTLPILSYSPFSISKEWSIILK